MLKALLIVAMVTFLILLWLYLIAPAKDKDCNAFKGIMFAHRGLHQPNIPENSGMAFKMAADAGYGVELDIQYSKDMKIVVFHDATLSRMCGVDKKVSECTYEELLNYSLDGTDEKIPLFSEVLEILSGAPLVCEIKNHNGNRNYKLCEDAFELLKNYKGLYCVESFSPFLVKWFRKVHHEIVRGQLSCSFRRDKEVDPATGFIMRNLLINFISRPDFISYRHKDTNTLGFKACSKIFNPLLIGWTAKGNEEQKLAWKKFNSVIFERLKDYNPNE